VIVVTAACGPFHAASTAAAFSAGAAPLPAWAFAGLPVAVAAAVVATAVPMRVGGRYLRGMEF